MLGGDKGRFAGDGVKWGTFGCFALVGYGSRKGDAYYGRGGTIDQMKSGFSGYQKNLRYRPIGYDCIGI